MGNLVWDRLQLIVFFMQEAMLSSLYIFYARAYLRQHALLHNHNLSTPPLGGIHGRHRAKAQRSMLWQLLLAHGFIITLDITALGIECADMVDWQAAIKPFVYGIKLKIEFFILNRLLTLVQPAAARREITHDHEPYDTSHGQIKGFDGVQHTPDYNQQQTYLARASTQGLSYGVRLVDVTPGNILRTGKPLSQATISSTYKG